MTMAINILLWLVLGRARVFAAVRGRVLLNDGARDGVIDFVKLLPRIGIGVVGSGFVAEVLPSALIPPWLGPGPALLGLPSRRRRRADAGRAGGRISIATAALKSGAGAPQVIAYTIAWALSRYTGCWCGRFP